MRLEGPRDGRPLVLSNALGTTHELWRAQLPALADEFRVVLYDHPPRPSVEALAGCLLARLDELELERVSFCGLSLGGMVGMQLAATAAERLDRLVLVSTSARFGTPAEWDDRADAVRAEGMSAVAEDALEKWLTPAFADRMPFLRMQLQTPAENYARGLEAIGGFDFRERLGSVRAPALVVAGAQDVATTPDDAAFLARGLADARLVVLERAAHLPNVEQPERFNAALLEHLG